MTHQQFNVYTNYITAPILGGEQSPEKEKVKSRILDLMRRVAEIPQNDIDTKQTDETRQ